jgi:D-beta-D-heptose 7-phosphate kinase/D-beta-D-heptose 1-phosphate adenosyltransferase
MDTGAQTGISAGDVVDLAALAGIVAQRQASGERGVLTNGCFDLLHLGHVRYLQHARVLGDFLVVALNSDASTRRLKGPHRPLVPQDERAALLTALACVDYVTIFDEPTAERTVAALSPSLYVKGGDYAGAGFSGDIVLSPDDLRAALGAEASEAPGSTGLAGLAQRLPEARTVASYGGSLVLLAYLPGHSTTELIERIVSRYATPSDPTSLAGDL